MNLVFTLSLNTCNRPTFLGTRTFFLFSSASPPARQHFKALPVTEVVAKGSCSGQGSWIHPGLVNHGPWGGHSWNLVNVARICTGAELGQSVSPAVCFQQEQQLNPDNPAAKGGLSWCCSGRVLTLLLNAWEQREAWTLCCGCSWCHTVREHCIFY